MDTPEPSEEELQEGAGGTGATDVEASGEDALDLSLKVASENLHPCSSELPLKAEVAEGEVAQKECPSDELPDMLEAKTSQCQWIPENRLVCRRAGDTQSRAVGGLRC